MDTQPLIARPATIAMRIPRLPSSCSSRAQDPPSPKHPPKSLSKMSHCDTLISYENVTNVTIPKICDIFRI